MLDAGDSISASAGFFQKCRVDGFVECGIIASAVGQIDLRVDDVVEGGAGERQRLHHAVLDDELGLELDRRDRPTAYLPSSRAFAATPLRRGSSPIGKRGDAPG